MLRKHLTSTAQELCASERWRRVDTPGSAQVAELADRLASPTEYRRFRSTPEGDYFLTVIEEFQTALNDEWMPFEIVGLSLNQAHEFLAAVAAASEREDLANALPQLRRTYSELKACGQGSNE